MVDPTHAALVAECPCCNGSLQHVTAYWTGASCRERTTDCYACRDGTYRGHDCTGRERE